MTLQLQVKQVYGTDRVYPMNETAQKLVALMGRKTFTKEEVQELKAMGFVLEWIPIAMG